MSQPSQGRSFRPLLATIGRHCVHFWNRLPVIPRDWCTMIVFLWLAYIVSGLLLGHTGAENNSALVFMLAVMLISSLTTGYAYGIAASLFGGFCTNYFFMYPFSAFSLSYA